MTRIYDKSHPYNAVFCEHLRSLIDGNPKTVQLQFSPSGYWVDVENADCGMPDLSWDKDWMYRIKPPEPVMIDRTVKYPAPMTVAPANGSDYWAANPVGARDYVWRGDHMDFVFLAAGICHLTSKAAQEQCDAFYGVQK